MNAFAYSEVRRETDQVQEQRGDPHVETARPAVGANEPSSHPHVVGPVCGDEDAFETFLGGAGI